jgi:protein-S-isoprenylcysteine O-methyltransferase Ste14
MAGCAPRAVSASGGELAKQATFTIHFPRWLGPITWTLGIALVHVALPFWISTFSYHRGWSAGRPGALNLLALIVVLSGIAVMAWAAREHFTSAPQGWDVHANLFDPPGYLIGGGPYAYSRNPLYVGELAMWLGWAIFFGSLAVIVATVVFWTIMAFVAIPYEERRLAAESGGAYERYRSEVPRWLGRP